MLKKVLLIVLAIILLTIIAAGIFIWQFELDDYRQDLEAAIEEHTGLDVAIAGVLSLVGTPQLELGASDITVKSMEDEIATLKNIDITMLWEPLLDRELVVEEVRIGAVEISLQLDEEGNLVLPEFPESSPGAEDTSGAPGLPLKKLIINSVVIDDLSVTIEQPGEEAPELVSVKDLDFVLENLLVADNDALLIGTWPDYLNYATLVSKINIDSVRYAGHELKDIQVNASHEGKVVNYDLRLNAYGGSATGSGSVDWQAGAITSSSELNAEALSLNEILRSFALNQKAEGVLGLELRGSSKIESEKTWLQNLQADVQLTGEDLEIDGLDIDKLFTKLVESQQLNLKDLGGFALAGPLALLVTKGSSYTGIVQGALVGETKIPVLYGEWHIAGQKAEFRDVALTTRKNRLAVKGHIDLEKQSYGPLEFYVLNHKGCSMLKRELNGTLAEPELGAIDFAASSILNPLLSLLDQGQGLVVDCKPVYEGRVEHPKDEGGEEQVEPESAPAED